MPQERPSSLLSPSRSGSVRLRLAAAGRALRTGQSADPMSPSITTRLKRSASKLLSKRGDKSDDVQWQHKNPLDMMSVADIVDTKRKADSQANQGLQRQGYRARLGSEQGIPWYIIDPTGRIVKEQRSDFATQKALSDDFAGLNALPDAVADPLSEQDAVTAIALVFTALVTPFGGFLGPRQNGTTLWLVNRAIDLVFIFDMFFKFFTMKLIAVDKASDAHVEWEMDLRVLAYDYIFSWWFLIDCASVAPSALDFLPVLGNGEGAGGLRVLRTLRSLRLIKLARLAKASRVIARMMEYVTLTSTTQTCITLACEALLLTHWFACILMISTTFASSIGEHVALDPRIHLSRPTRLIGWVTERNGRTNGARR